MQRVIEQKLSSQYTGNLSHYNAITAHQQCLIIDPLWQPIQNNNANTKKRVF